MLLRHITLALFISCFSLPTYAADPLLPDFAGYTDVKAKKKAFFGFIQPMVIKANAKIQQDRQALIGAQLTLQAGESLSPAQDKHVKAMIAHYNSKLDGVNLASVNKLLTQVDSIPPSLAMAQSANESAWGTSRFAKQAYNFFGHWCFKKGCGLVPARRNAGSSHEVRKFISPQGSVTAYIHNINTGRAYAGLRKIRAQKRAQNKAVSGYDLAAGLTKYSERGQEYVNEIRSMISYNKLAKYDNKTE
jgi:Bax protein